MVKASDMKMVVEMTAMMVPVSEESFDSLVEGSVIRVGVIEDIAIVEDDTPEGEGSIYTVSKKLIVFCSLIPMTLLLWRIIVEHMIETDVEG